MALKKIFGWLTLDMLLFAAANVLLIFCFSGQLARISTVGYFQLLVLGLAAYRAANILSNEAVTKPLRAPFVDEVSKEGKVVEQPKKGGFLQAVGLLIYCPSCTGVWLAAALVYSYAFWPGPTFAIAFLLALSTIERIVAALVGRLRQ